MKILNKDITTIEGPAVIAHGVNCQGKMGSGVAKAIITKWPEVKEAYLQYENKKLGYLNRVNIGNLIIYNCFTQQYYGYDNKRYANIIAIIQCLYAILILHDELPLYIPKIGCGLGGLDWEVVKQVLEDLEEITQKEITVCTLENI